VKCLKDRVYNGNSNGMKHNRDGSAKEDYSKYGIVNGQVHWSKLELQCAIISSGWPSWALGVTARGWQIKIMIIKDNCWYSVICKLFPNILILRYEECNKCVGLGIQVQVWFSDVDPPRS
jgi:hypothetical protein